MDPDGGPVTQRHPVGDAGVDPYSQRARLAVAVYEDIVLPDDFLPHTCAGSSAVLQGIFRHFGHHVGRTGVTPVEQGPGGEQVHVVAYDDRYVYDLTYTQFRRLHAFGSPIIDRAAYETRFLLLPRLTDPLGCGPDFYRPYLGRLRRPLGSWAARRLEG